MVQKLRVNFNCRRRKRRVDAKILVLALVVAALEIHLPRMSVSAKSCPDLKIIFARGSGAEVGTSADYLEFKSTIETKLNTTELDYEFMDLDYPAVGVGIDNLEIMLGAFLSGGEGYKFGKSVNAGVENLAKIATSECRDTKYVLGGYSQGAMVLLKAIPYFRPEQLIYVATFGDPKIYLPEGEGIIPAACRGENLSDYRMYVPDCQAYKGLLGAYIPYEPEAYKGKMRTWCNKRDIFCSSHFSVNDHVGYVSEGLYEDASRVIFDKITKTFGIENTAFSPHDTAFLIDSTGSMSAMIDKYKAEALRLAQETLENGGRVALYEYRDLWDPYSPVQHCGFEDCTLEKFEQELGRIQASNGGDTAESLLSASFQVMQEQNWKLGSTKSMVVLTDANYLSPDRDGVTFDQVVKLSKEIDPVNFYIITKPNVADGYTELARQTDGKVVTNFDELSLLTDYIMQRYDSLPRVVEMEASFIPELEINKVNWINENTLKINFETTGEQTLVIVNEMIIGATSETALTISDLNSDAMIILVPVYSGTRGDAVVVEIPENSMYGEDTPTSELVQIPGVPNTGRL